MFFWTPRHSTMGEVKRHPFRRCQPYLEEADETGNHDWHAMYSPTRCILASRFLLRGPDDFSSTLNGLIRRLRQLHEAKISWIGLIRKILHRKFTNNTTAEFFNEFELGTTIQCWFKLYGRNEQNLNFQTRFSQIGLRLDKKWTEQKLLRISPELIWCHFFAEILNKNFTPKMGHFGFFKLIKNYAETTL